MSNNVSNTKNKTSLESKKITERKFKALLNMGAIISIFILLYFGNTMTNTVGTNSSLDAFNTIISKNLKDKSIIVNKFTSSKDHIFAYYESDNSKGIFEFSRHKFLYNRYSPDSNYKISESIGFVVIDKNIIVIGDFSHTAAYKIKLNVDGNEQEKILGAEKEILIFDTSESYSKIKITVLDKDNNDITSTF